MRVAAAALAGAMLATAVVRAQETLWAEELDRLPVVTGLRADRREVLVTTATSAEPQRVRDLSSTGQ